MLAAMFSGLIGLQWWLFSLLALTMGLPLSWWMYYKSLFRAAQVCCVLMHVLACVASCLSACL